MLAAIFTNLDASAAENDAAEYFRGRQITLAYSSLEAYNRLLARHLPKYLPGSPKVIVQDIGGAGGLILANQTFNTARKDGTFLAMIRGSTLQSHVNGDPAAKFDGRKFAWIGNMNKEHDGCIVWNPSNVQSMGDLYTKELIFGASGAGSQSYTFPLVYNAILQTKFKLIPGYGGLESRLIAMERGELMGGCGYNTGTIKSQMATQYQERKFRLIFQGGLSKDKDFADVPNILDQAKNEADRQALQYLFATLELGRPFAAPAETPPDRVAFLRAVFDQTMKDPDLLAEANKLLMPIDGMNADETATAVARLYATPPSVISRVEGVLNSRQ